MSDDEDLDIEEEDEILDGPQEGRRTKTKEVKKIKERKRRGKMIESIAELRKLVPQCHTDQRINQAVVMEYTVDYITALEQRLKALEEERKTLLKMRRKQRKTQRASYPMSQLLHQHQQLGGRESADVVFGPRGQTKGRTRNPNGVHGPLYGTSGSQRIGMYRPTAMMVDHEPHGENVRANIGNHATGFPSYYRAPEDFYDPGFGLGTKTRRALDEEPEKLRKIPRRSADGDSAVPSPRITSNSDPFSPNSGHGNSLPVSSNANPQQLLAKTSVLPDFQSAQLPSGRSISNSGPTVRAHFTPRKPEPVGLIGSRFLRNDREIAVQDDGTHDREVLRMQNSMPPYKTDKLPPYQVSPDIPRRPAKKLQVAPIVSLAPSAPVTTTNGITSATDDHHTTETSESVHNGNSVVIPASDRVGTTLNTPGKIDVPLHEDLSLSDTQRNNSLPKKVSAFLTVEPLPPYQAKTEQV